MRSGGFTRRMLAVAVAVALASAACGSGDDAAGDGATPAVAEISGEASGDGGSTDGGDIGLPDPCGLLDVDFLAATSGLTFAAGEPGDPALTPAGGRSCTWRVDDPYGIVHVLLGPGSVFDDATAGGFESGEPDDWEDLEVAGAAVGRIQNTGDVAAVVVGDVYAQVANGVVGAAGEVDRDWTVALVTEVAANL